MNRMQSSSQSVIRVIHHFQTPLPSCHVFSSDLTSESESSDVEAPSYSSISSATDDESCTPESMDECDEEESDQPAMDSTPIVVIIYCVLHTPCFTQSNTNFQSELEDENPPEESQWFGYKFVGDNVDKNVKPSYQRQELQGQSLYHFHGYAVRDRVDLSGLSDEAPPFSTPDATQFLPTTKDISSLKEELHILVARYVAVIIILMILIKICFQYCRILIAYEVGHFKDQKLIPQHIKSRYNKEMASKSEVVSKLKCHCVDCNGTLRTLGLRAGFHIANDCAGFLSGGGGGGGPRGQFAPP